MTTREPQRACGACMWHKRICKQHLAAAHKAEVAWFNRTQHCGLCGNPGAFCTCTEQTPCGCRHLHDLGSARLEDALDAFMPTIVSVDQGELFGDAS